MSGIVMGKIGDLCFAFWTILQLTPQGRILLMFARAVSFVLALHLLGLLVPDSVYSDVPRKIRRIKNRFITRQIDSPRTLQALGLSASGDVAEQYLLQLGQQIANGLQDSRYLFLFRKRKNKRALVRDKNNRPLEYVFRSSFDQFACVSAVPIDESEILLGDNITAATHGVCGPISVMHSLLKLGLKSAEDVVSGSFFSETAMNEIFAFQKTSRTGMNPEEQKAAHAGLGAPQCVESQIIRTGSRRKLGAFNNELDGYVNSEQPRWDCSLIVLHKASTGVYFLAHTEHVVGVTLGGGKEDRRPAVITTVNGFAQGNTTSTIPSSPGNNTWVTIPGGRPASYLRNSTHPDRRKYLGAIPRVLEIKYVCCRE